MSNTARLAIPGESAEEIGSWEGELYDEYPSHVVEIVDKTVGGAEAFEDAFQKKAGHFDRPSSATFVEYVRRLTQLRLVPNRVASPRADRQVDILKEWEGIVEKVEGAEFNARLIDLNDESSAQELVRIEMDSISQEDHKLVEEGAVFYWTIWRETDRFGKRETGSEIRFRRLPAWTESDLKRAEDEAVKLRRELFGEHDE